MNTSISLSVSASGTLYGETLLEEFEVKLVILVMLISLCTLF